MKYMVNLVAINAKDKTECEIETEVFCAVRLVNGRNLKALAKLEYMGIIINDIHVIEKRGELSIVYPENYFTGRDGKERTSTIVFPKPRELAQKFNHIIQQEYSKTAFERVGGPALKIHSSSNAEDNENATAFKAA